MGKCGSAWPDAGIFRAKHAPGSGFAGIYRPARTANRAIARLAGGHGAFSSINAGCSSINGGLGSHDGAKALGMADLSILNQIFSTGNETPASGVACLPYLTKAFP
jgi:hypothetical protein